MQSPWFDQREMRVHPACHGAILDLTKQIVIAGRGFENHIGVVVAGMINQQINRITIFDRFGHFAIAKINGWLIVGFLKGVDIVKNIGLKCIEPRL